MKSYVVLLRGINVGGKNKIAMAQLKVSLEEQGYTNVLTYIQSGNVLLDSDLNAEALGKAIEAMLVAKFKLDSALIRVLCLTHDELQSIVKDRPKGFGDETDTYHSDAVFLIGIPMNEAMAVFDPKPGVDRVWPGKGVIYFDRLSELRTKSRLSKIIGTKPYESMTIRNWNTTTKLLALMDGRKTK